jgi:hypothetical protein
MILSTYCVGIILIFEHFIQKSKNYSAHIVVKILQRFQPLFLLELRPALDRGRRRYFVVWVRDENNP